MAGGLSQLVAYGAQDVYLTGNPQITFFKTVYRRYTNFAVESIQQTINGSVGFGNKVSTQISRNGDLITDVVIEFVLSKNVTGANNTFFPAEQMLQDVELEIGGQRIDKHYADWFRTYDSLFRMNDDRFNYRRMTDFVDGESTLNSASPVVKRFYVPLIFFFNQTPGLALPLIALQYHEVKLYFTLASQVNGVNVNNAGVTPATVTAPQMSVWVDYIFLDTQERTRFAQLPHEYLIEQLQFTGSETAVPSATSQASQNIRLDTLGRKSITPFTSGHCGWENRLDFQAPAMVQVFC
ncbi:major capsid protein VP54 [Paramecium bursaria Chlorella virus NE-JV-1]|nr:major capsid protein VP54 [Paramecium bursaria Chlorella virus NE-JV-1]